MRVRVGGIYKYTGNGLFDALDGHPVTPGTLVKVINLPGAPKANTMGHCYIGDVSTGKFLALVQTASLDRRAA
jgi:hypothetical protein